MNVRIPTGIAERLLIADPTLARLRYLLVPARLREKVFWMQYAEQLALRIGDAITDNYDPQRDFCNPPNVMRRSLSTTLCCGGEEHLQR